MTSLATLSSQISEISQSRGEVQKGPRCCEDMARKYRMLLRKKTTYIRKGAKIAYVDLVDLLVETITTHTHTQIFIIYYIIFGSISIPICFTRI
jgi:hypothetical protein